jgi:replicative DNA helicase
LTASALAAGFRELSNELNCVVALLSQPTVSQRRGGSPPTDADTKGGGSISEAADVILTPWLPHKVDEAILDAIGPGQMLPAEIYVRKNRDGETGIIGDQKVCFDRARMIFKEA